MVDWKELRASGTSAFLYNSVGHWAFTESLGVINKSGTLIASIKVGKYPPLAKEGLVSWE